MRPATEVTDTRPLAVKTLGAAIGAGRDLLAKGLGKVVPDEIAEPIADVATMIPRTAQKILDAATSDDASVRKVVDAGFDTVHDTWQEVGDVIGLSNDVSETAADVVTLPLRGAKEVVGWVSDWF